MTFLLTANRGLHRRPGGWTPKQLGTLSLWLDADDATTVTLSTGVSQWDDKSGAAHHVTQATGANQPAWVKGAQNGRAALRFTGTSTHYLTGGDVLDLLAGGISVAVARNHTSGAHISKTNGNVDVNGEWAVGATFGDVQLGGTRVVTEGGTGGNSVSVWVLDRTNGATFHIGGTQVDSDTGAPFPNTTSYNIATALTVGARANLGNPFTGDMYEVVASLSTWTTDERQKVEGYLAHKWGLTASLDAGHPYKAVAP